MGIQAEKETKQTQRRVKEPIRYTSPTFQLHTFTLNSSEKTIVFQVIKMVESVMIFINFIDNLILSDLSLGMFNTRTTQVPISTRIIGDFTEEYSKNLATKFAKKLRKSVYISCNLVADRLIVLDIERRLCEEIRNKPDKF